MHPDWIIPQWPAPANVHAVCTTRAGGASHVPFDTMNLGDHVGDNAQHVAQNRALLHSAIHAEPVFLTQVHGIGVVEHGPTTLTAPTAPHKPLVADACITRHAGVACTIMVADCLPVLFSNRQGTVVGAAHAGWRSLAGTAGQVGQTGLTGSGVLEATRQQLGDVAATDILVWLGPCIGPEKFEVGAEVRDAFLSHAGSAHAALARTLFKPCGSGKWLADLAGLARLRLRALGIENNVYGNDSSPGWCTVSQPLQFFSHRRDARTLGSSGRMAACVWLS